MKLQKSWLPFIIMNVIISAATILIVLAIWTLVRTNPAANKLDSVINEQTTTHPTLPALDEVVINIENVFGYGELQTEVVRIRHVGSEPLMLQDWYLADAEGNRYIFPALTLYNGVVEVYTRSGSNTVISLFWGLSQPIWQQGEFVKIYDSDGNLRSSFQVP